MGFAYGRKTLLEGRGFTMTYLDLGVATRPLPLRRGSEQRAAKDLQFGCRTEQPVRCQSICCESFVIDLEAPESDGNSMPVTADVFCSQLRCLNDDLSCSRQDCINLLGKLRNTVADQCGVASEVLRIRLRPSADCLADFHKCLDPLNGVGRQQSGAHRLETLESDRKTCKGGER